MGASGPGPADVLSGRTVRPLRRRGGVRCVAAAVRGGAGAGVAGRGGSAARESGTRDGLGSGAWAWLGTWGPHTQRMLDPVVKSIV